MTSFLYTASSQAAFESEIQQFCDTHGIDPIDRQEFSLATFVKEGKKDQILSLGVDEVKIMQQAMLLKPIRSIAKVIIINQADLLTLPAQNALLKVLEEPPANTFILMTTTNRDALLPTIHSRCQIISIRDRAEDTVTESEDKIVEVLTTLSPGQALKRAELLAKDKEQALAYLRKNIIAGRMHMLTTITKNNTSDMPLFLEKLQRAYTILSTTNTNPRLVLENLFLSL